ncbi:RYR1 protein, partial [Haliaeetus albicilla]|nr:RYR1 protein [Haliaeetus albicilla]
PGTLQELISQTMVHWAQESFIQSPELVRAMFSLLHRQYDGLGELVRALPKAYTISALSVPDTTALLECLGQIRSLLIVQMGPEEENLMIQSIGWVPGPCRGHPLTPCPHQSTPHPRPAPSVLSEHPIPLSEHPISPLSTPRPPLSTLHPHPDPCVPSEHPTSPSEHPASPSSTLCPHQARCIPIQPPYLPPRHPAHPAQAPHIPTQHPVCGCLPQVVTYLASCGLQSCPMLLSKGYPDIGWNPCGGERYLDFLRFAVFVNGESVEENANVVVRLLIR